MAQLSTEEHALVDELLECIATAMDRLEDIDPKYATKTKLQKLLYLAVDEFNLPLTYSWYLAGAVVPSDPVTPSGLESAFDELPSPDEPTDDAAPADQSVGTLDEIVESIDDSGIQPSHHSGVEPIDPVLFSDKTDSEPDPDPTPSSEEFGDRRGEIIDFYTSTIPDVWYQNTMRFLQNFYLDHAPPAYRDFYVQSTHLRTRLREVETIVAAHLDDEQTAQSIDDIAKSTSLDISDLHCTIRSSDSLSATFDGFVRGTDLIEDGLMMLTDRESASLEQEHLAVIRSMQEFFYYYVWRYPCLVISQETATGPSADSLRARHQDRLADFEAELDRAADQFERELAAAGLRPDYTDYTVSNDDVTETIASLADQYLE
ncbi:hypothetical protein [Natrinema sp. SYSU A 869]|uniref:hypothetical protein n=1 Tax=Natrinema sp. SYSU A 869 TaxID=2871694 RepID=UPI001CA38CC9|nr:hypothetical protein [Natrinema sp. SYSU A 869]